MNLRSSRGAERDGLEPIVPNGDNLPSVPGSDADLNDEGEDDGNGRDIRNPPGINPAGRLVQPHFNNRKFKHVLSDASQFKRYWQKLESHFYGCGPEFSKYWFKALKDKDDEDPNPDDDDTNARRVAWETIFNSLADKEAAKIKTVPMGAVEKLLRKIRMVYSARNDASLDQLRRKYQSAKLSNYDDLSSYIAFLENCTIDFEEYECPLDPRDRKFRLLEGLPPDYGVAVTALRLPGSDFSWEQLTTYLLNFAATNKRIAGAIKTDSDKVLATVVEGPREVCRNFTNTGKCRFGKKCKYVHPDIPADRQVNIPPTPPRAPGRKPIKCFNCGEAHHVRQCPTPCSYCGVKGHGEEQCFKKHNNQDAVNATSSDQSNTSSQTIAGLDIISLIES